MSSDFTLVESCRHFSTFMEIFLEEPSHGGFSRFLTRSCACGFLGGLAIPWTRSNVWRWVQHNSNQSEPLQQARESVKIIDGGGGVLNNHLKIRDCRRNLMLRPRCVT